MNIKVKLTRSENINYYKTEEIELDIEEYVRGVVPSEVGNAALEAGKAQAVAARTFALRKYKTQGYITDKSSVDQAFRASRFSQAYARAHQAVKETAGEVLYYQGSLLNNAYYSASNGGRTVSSQERWGGVRPYLISQDDPWDFAATNGKKTGHGVGMSQAGAKYAASIGKTYKEILAFYYVGTEIRNNYGENNMISASALIEKCKQPLDEKWGYVWGGRGQTWTQASQNSTTREETKKYGQKWVGKRVVDCSGLLYWAFKELGGYIYHGSNTMWKSYCTKKGTLNSTSNIKPGTAVFLLKGTNYHHVGIYIGNDTVIESRSTKDGVMTSKLSHWDCWGELKGVDYSNVTADDIEKINSIILQKGDSGILVKELQTGLNKLGYNAGTVDGKFGNNTLNALLKFQKDHELSTNGICDNNTWVVLNKVLETESNQEEVHKMLYEALVTAQTGSSVNMRSKPAITGTRITQVKTGQYVSVLEEGGEWCKIEYNGKVGYMMTKFLSKKAATENNKTWYLKVECENESEARALLATIQRLAKAKIALG